MGGAEIAIMERNIYAKALVNTATDKMRNVFLVENLNPSVDCETDSNPAKAHGARTTTPKIAEKVPTFGAKSGWKSNTLNPFVDITVLKPISIPVNKTKAAIV